MAKPIPEPNKKIFCQIVVGNPDDHPGHKEYPAAQYARLTYARNETLEYGFGHWFGELILSDTYAYRYWQSTQRSDGVKVWTWFVEFRKLDGLVGLAQASFCEDFELIRAETGLKPEQPEPVAIDVVDETKPVGKKIPKSKQVYDDPDQLSLFDIGGMVA